MVATLQMRQSPDCQTDTCDYSSHMVCPAGADWLSTPNLAWIQLHCNSMLMSHNHVVSNFSICWLTFPKVVGYFSCNGFASLSQLVLDGPDIFILHITNYFCCSFSWLMLNNWKLTSISFSAILFIMVAHLGFIGEALVMSLLSHDFLEWLDVHIFEWGRLKAILIQFECCHPESGL